MKLIDNWKDAWKFSSNWFQAAAVAFFTYTIMVPDALLKIWLLLPEDIKSHIPSNYTQGIGVVLVIGGVIARIVKQNSLHNPVGEKGKPTVQG